jgi:hypothetical protein
MEPHRNESLPRKLCLQANNFITRFNDVERVLLLQATLQITPIFVSNFESLFASNTGVKFVTKLVDNIRFCFDSHFVLLLTLHP